MHLCIHQDDTVEDQIILIKHEVILDARELKHHVDVLYLCRQGLIVQMILHTIHPDILTGKQIQARHRRINGLRAIVKHGIDIEAR